jgi:hypothetical protein
MSTSPNPNPTGLSARKKIPLSIVVPSKAVVDAMEAADKERIKKLEGVDPAHPDYTPEVYMLVRGNLPPQEDDPCDFFE